MEETEDRDVHDAMCSDSYSEDDVLTDEEDEMMRQKIQKNVLKLLGMIQEKAQQLEDREKTIEELTKRVRELEQKKTCETFQRNERERSVVKQMKEQKIFA